MSSLLLLIYCLFLPVQENHRIEIFLFEEKCIPIEMVQSSRSFYLSWYDKARLYEPKGIPLLTAHDILEFDKEEFKIILNKSGSTIMSNLEVPGNGIPVQLVIDGKVVYGAWIWNMLSSQSCDGVMFQIIGSAPNIIHINSFSKEAQGLRIPKILKQN